MVVLNGVKRSIENERRFGQKGLGVGSRNCRASILLRLTLLLGPERKPGLLVDQAWTNGKGQNVFRFDHSSKYQVIFRNFLFNFFSKHHVTIFKNFSPNPFLYRSLIFFSPDRQL